MTIPATTAGPQVAGAGAGPHQEPSVWASEPDFDVFIWRAPSALAPAIADAVKMAMEKRIITQKREYTIVSLQMQDRLCHVDAIFYTYA